MSNLNNILFFFVALWLSSFGEDVSMTIHRTLLPNQSINITIPLDTVILTKNQNTSYSVLIIFYYDGYNYIDLYYSDGQNQDVIYVDVRRYAFFPQCCSEKTPPLNLYIVPNDLDHIINITLRLDFEEIIPLTFSENQGRQELERGELRFFRLDLTTPEFLRNFTFPGTVTIRSMAYEVTVTPPTAPLMSGLGLIPHIFNNHCPPELCQKDYNIHSLSVTVLSIPLNTPDDLGVYFIIAGCPVEFINLCKYSRMDLSLTVTLSYPIPLSLGSKIDVEIMNREYKYFSLNLTKLNISTEYPCYVELNLLKNSGAFIYIAKNYIPSTDIHLKSLIHDNGSPLSCFNEKDSLHSSWKTNEIIVLNSEEDLGVYYILLMGYNANTFHTYFEVSLKQPEEINMDICNTFYLYNDQFQLYKVFSENLDRNYVMRNFDIIKPDIPLYLKMTNFVFFGATFSIEQGYIPTSIKRNSTYRNDSYYALIWNLDNYDVCDGITVDAPVPYGIGSHLSCNEGNCQVNLDSNKAVCQCKLPYIGDTCQLTCPQTEHVICSGRGHCEEDIFSSTAICNCPPGFMGSQCQLQCNDSNCNFHGTCHVTTNNTEQVSCLCHNGYFGRACDKFCSPEVNCSTHGNCEFVMNESSRCICDVGWDGQDCSLRVMMFLDTSVWIYSINSIVALVGLGVLLVILVVVIMMRRKNRTRNYEYMENKLND